MYSCTSSIKINDPRSSIAIFCQLAKYITIVQGCPLGILMHSQKQLELVIARIRFTGAKVWNAFDANLKTLSIIKDNQSQIKRKLHLKLLNQAAKQLFIFFTTIA